MDSPQNAVEPAPDHRVRVARQRRERMRKRLLRAVLVSYAETPFGGPPSAETVIAQADVSKATFYKYFASIEEAVQALGQEMADDMVEVLKRMFAPEHTPAFRMAAAMQIFLLRSAREPVWAAFVSRTDVLGATNEVRRGIGMQISDARETGFLQFTSQASALALAVGTLQEGMRHLALTSSPDPVAFPSESVLSFVHDVMLLILGGLGADPGAAAELLKESSGFIRTSAPDRLPSWRDAITELRADS